MARERTMTSSTAKIVKRGIGGVLLVQRVASSPVRLRTGSHTADQKHTQHRQAHSSTQLGTQGAQFRRAESAADGVAMAAGFAAHVGRRLLCVAVTLGVLWAVSHRSRRRIRRVVAVNETRSLEVIARCRACKTAACSLCTGGGVLRSIPQLVHRGRSALRSAQPGGSAVWAAGTRAPTAASNPGGLSRSSTSRFGDMRARRPRRAARSEAA